MAKKGLSVPFFGEYTNSSGTVTYANGRTIGHAIEYSLDAETSDDNPLYGDNMIVEHDFGTFQKGTLTLNTSELTGPLSKWLLGLSEATQNVGSGNDAVTVTEYVFDDDITPRTCGFGIIELHQINDVDKYKTIVLCKITPQIPAESCTTKGETVDWQTPELTFTVQRSDAAKHPWKIEAWHDSEAAAVAYLQAKLGVEST